MITSEKKEKKPANIVFSNTFERKVNEDQVDAAQVMILESEDEWKVLWFDGENSNGQSDCWFKGRQWDEMLAVFRSRLSEKLESGYVPHLK